MLRSTVDEGVLVSEGTDSVVEIKGEIFCLASVIEPTCSATLKAMSIVGLIAS